MFHPLSNFHLQKKKKKKAVFIMTRSQWAFQPKHWIVSSVISRLETDQKQDGLWMGVMI